MVDTAKVPDIFGGDKLPDISGGLIIYPADPLSTRRVVKSEYIGLMDRKGVAVEVVDGQIVEIARNIAMRVKIKRMSAPGIGGGLIVRGEVFMATRAEAADFTKGGLAERVTPEPEIVAEVEVEPVIETRSEPVALTPEVEQSIEPEAEPEPADAVSALTPLPRRKVKSASAPASRAKTAPKAKTKTRTGARSAR